MGTVEIPREQWVRRLNEFTLVHDGWLVSLDVLGRELGAQHEVENLPLIGVAADRLDDDGTVAISVARSGREHFTHVIQRVTRIWLESDDGAETALAFESADGLKTILRFRVAALPETVDGILRR